MKLSGGPLPTSSTQNAATAAAPTAIAGHGIGRMFLISWAEGTSAEISAAIAISPGSCSAREFWRRWQIGRKIGSAEVFRQQQAEQERNADGHLGIAGK